MNGVIIMSEKDLEKMKIMQLLLNKQLTQGQAAKLLDITERQVRDIFKKYKEFGDKGVISKKIGRPSNHQLSEDLLSKALTFLTTIYHDCGPTLAKEKLSKVKIIKDFRRGCSKSNDYQ